MPKKKTKQPQNPSACVFCKSDADDEAQFGTFFHSKGLSVHNFCLLFSSGLSQNGKNDNDGFAGFLPKDICREVARGHRLRCSYCKTLGATVGCCKPACKKVFHLTCGQKNNSLHVFHGSFPSYCSSHKPKPIYPEAELPTKELYCAICYNVVCLENYDTTIWTSCCKNGWFHKMCIQRQALSAGYFFRCPLCNNTEQFQKQMLIHGIYIPQQDAAWELEENAFQELLFRHECCDAICCNCPKGRQFNKKNTPWRVVLCGDCGSEGRHVGCDDSVTAKFTWRCPACVEISEKLKSQKTECLSKTKKTKVIQKSQLPQDRSKRKMWMLRNCPRNSGSVEDVSSVEDKISVSTKEENNECRETRSEELHEDGPSFSSQLYCKNYEIIKFPKSEPPEKIENSANPESGTYEVSNRYLQHSPLQDSSLTLGSEEPNTSHNLLNRSRKSKRFSMQSETESENCTEDKDSEQGVYLFSEVVSSIFQTKLDYLNRESEISSLQHNQTVKCLNDNLLSTHEEAHNLPNKTNSSCLIPLDYKSENSVSGISERASAEKVMIPQHHKEKCDGTTSITEAENCSTACTNTPCEKIESTGLATDPDDCETVLHQKISPVDISCNSIKKKESMEMSKVEGSLSQSAVSPCDIVKNSNKIPQVDSKRMCTETEYKVPKKRKLNTPVVKPHNGVIILSLAHDIKQNLTKNTLGTKHKEIDEISSPKTENVASSSTSSSNSMIYDGHEADDRSRKGAFGTENTSCNTKAPIILNVQSPVHSSERDHREPLGKVDIPNGLAQNSLKMACTTNGDSVDSHSGGVCTSRNTQESENRALKKKLSNVVSKKKYTTSFKYKDSYLCIKALLGQLCDCCKEKSRLLKQTNGKNSSHRRCAQSCKRKYDVGLYKSGSSSSKSDAKSSGNKHSCDYSRNYVIKCLKSGPPVPSINETEEKLSGKPQVIHLKNVSY